MDHLCTNYLTFSLIVLLPWFNMSWVVIAFVFKVQIFSLIHKLNCPKKWCRNFSCRPDVFATLRPNIFVTYNDAARFVQPIAKNMTFVRPIAKNVTFVRPIAKNVTFVRPIAKNVMFLQPICKSWHFYDCNIFPTWPLYDWDIFPMQQKTQ